MKQVVASQNKVLENQFSNQIGNSVELEDFYKTEARFLDYLYSSDKVKAQQTIRDLIEHVSNYSQANKVSGFKYYFITLSGIIARHIEKQHYSVEKAFSYNSKCIMLIEEKLTKDNASNIADELIEFYQYMSVEKEVGTLMHRTVNKVIEYIDEEIESPMTVEGIAQMFDVSTSHLSRIFREHTGITLVEYINIKKVEESQYYLRFSEEKISDISNHFNFCNQSYYTRIFKKYTGETPRRFRNNLTDNYFNFTFSKTENQLTDGE